MTRFTILALLCLIAARASAQTTSDPSSKATVHIGRVAALPTIALTNVGVDNNVFNDPTFATPKSDFTATTQVKADLWLHLRRSLLSASVKDDFVYYQTYANQRSVNGYYGLGLNVPLNRISFKANTDYVHAMDRPGFEIDARLPRTEFGYDGAVEVRVGGKTFAGVRASRRQIEFDQSGAFAGTVVRALLNRTETSQGLTLRYRLTPLTTLTFDAGKAQDRFEFSPLRDADSTSILVGAQLDPFALLKGSARLGYTEYRPLGAGLPAYKGPVGSADLAYVLRGATRVTLVGARDIEYSYDLNQPYYVQTGGTLRISQQVAHAVDVVGSLGLQHLDYRDREGVPVAIAGRVDVVHTYLMGVGYRLGGSLRAGLNLERQRRDSPVAGRNYNNFRWGLSATYEF